jgi:hypothetical protein
MKTITLITMLVAFSTFGQLEIKKETRRTESIWKIMTGHEISASIESEDTVYFFAFRDATYQYITEYEIILFSNEAELVQFLDLIQQTSDDKEKIETSKYSLRPSSGKNLYIWEGDAFCLFNTRYLSKIRVKLEEFKAD